MKKALLIALLAALVPSTALADMELQGEFAAATVIVDGEATGVEYNGNVVTHYVDGQTHISVFTATNQGSLVIKGDVSNLVVEVCANDHFEDTTLSVVEPIVEAPQAPEPVVEEKEAGPSIEEMNREQRIADWTKTYRDYLNSLPF